MADTTSRPLSSMPLLLSVRAVAIGLLIGLAGANVWPILLRLLGMPAAGVAETAFLALYFWWASGGGGPASIASTRSSAFGRISLTKTEWLLGIGAAASFAIFVHASIVVLFRLIPFPVVQFRAGYNFGEMSLPLKWVAICISAASAGICEETGFRGYMQRPIEKRHGAVSAILVSSILFTLLHLNKGWAMLGMVPIVLVAGVLLGMMAWATQSLIPGMIAHTFMDVGLFAYWWTGTAGTFHATTISETGFDVGFVLALSVAGLALAATLAAILKFRRLSPQSVGIESKLE